MNLLIASDHAGILIKSELIKYLKSNEHIVKDLGTFSKESVNYPDYSYKVAQSINIDNYNKAIVICSTGEGISIATNRYKGIRCMLCNKIDLAITARKFFDINVLGLGANNHHDSLYQIVDAFLYTEFDASAKNISKRDNLNKL